MISGSRLGLPKRCAKARAIRPTGYSRRFGRLKPHRVKRTRDPEHPEITLMGVTSDNSTSDKLVLDRGQGWHADSPWDVEICKATQLYGLEIPSYGGDTLFASMHAAYGALPERLETRIAPLKVEFGYGGRERKGMQRLDPEDQKAPPAVYDMVRVHPETGRKSLYVNRTHVIRIVGMPEVEGDRLLAELVRDPEKPRHAVPLLVERIEIAHPRSLPLTRQHVH